MQGRVNNTSTRDRNGAEALSPQLNCSNARNSAIILEGRQFWPIIERRARPGPGAAARARQHRPRIATLATGHLCRRTRASLVFAPQQESRSQLRAFINTRRRTSLMWRLAMQQSSETIGTIAAALAKAQAQLVNPEKSLVGTIRSDKAGASERCFATRRYRAALTLCARL